MLVFDKKGRRSAFPDTHRRTPRPDRTAVGVRTEPTAGSTSLSEQGKEIVKKLLAGQRSTFGGRGAGITVEHADAAAPPNCGTRELPVVDGRCATRTRATLSTAFLIYCIPHWR
jgi:hypothetical protein